MTVKLTLEFRVGDFLKSTRHLYTAESLSPMSCTMSTAGCEVTRKYALPSSVLSSDQWAPVAAVDFDGGPSGNLGVGVASTTGPPRLTSQLKHENGRQFRQTGLKLINRTLCYDMAMRSLRRTLIIVSKTNILTNMRYISGVS